MEQQFAPTPTFRGSFSAIMAELSITEQVGEIDIKLSVIEEEIARLEAVRLISQTPWRLDDLIRELREEEYFLQLKLQML